MPPWKKRIASTTTAVPVDEEPPGEDDLATCEADISHDEDTTEGTLTDDDTIPISELVTLLQQLQQLLEGEGFEACDSYVEKFGLRVAIEHQTIATRGGFTTD